MSDEDVVEPRWFLVVVIRERNFNRTDPNGATHGPEYAIVPIIQDYYFLEQGGLRTISATSVLPLLPYRRPTLAAVGDGDEEEDHVDLNDDDYIENEEHVADIINQMFREQPSEYNEPPSPEDFINSLEAIPAAGEPRH